MLFKHRFCEKRAFLIVCESEVHLYLTVRSLDFKFVHTEDLPAAEPLGNVNHQQPIMHKCCLIFTVSLLRAKLFLRLFMHLFPEI